MQKVVNRKNEGTTEDIFENKKASNSVRALDIVIRITVETSND